MLLRNAFDALASVLLPAPCRICGQTLTSASRIPICEPCLASFERIADPMCHCCGWPFVSAVAAQAIDPLCRLCRANFYAFEQARTFAIYGDALSQAITLLKYEEVARLGDWFAARLAEVFSPVAADWRPNVVVPVPLFPARRRERGYNQSDLIAQPLAKRLGLRLESRILTRIKPRPPQLLLSRTERWKSVRGAYATREPLRVDNLRVLLIDDVLTTGATLDSCARTLKKAGAVAVFGLTVARIVPGWISRGPVAAAPSSAVSGNRMAAKSISSTTA